MSHVLQQPSFSPLSSRCAEREAGSAGASTDGREIKNRNMSQWRQHRYFSQSVPGNSLKLRKRSIGRFWCFEWRRVDCFPLLGEKGSMVVCKGSHHRWITIFMITICVIDFPLYCKQRCILGKAKRV